MKSRLIAFSAVAVFGCGHSSAAALLLNFRTPAGGDVSGSYLTLDPAHATGAVPLSETTWNNFGSTAASSSLSWSDGSAATGVTITFGIEVTGGDDVLSYTTSDNFNTGLAGSGGAVPGNENLTANPDSIYGSGTGSDNTAPGRAGWFGNSGRAIGFRVDGLPEGEYALYAMARNTNSNPDGVSMDVHTTTGASATSFDFSSTTPVTQTNPSYPSGSTEYTSFASPDNYVLTAFTIGAGDSLFLAVEGSSAELRGFLNTVQIVAVPEPGAAMLGLLATGLLALRRRRA